MGMGVLADFIYNGGFDVFNSLDPKEQNMAMWGLLSISKYMTGVFAHVNEITIEEVLKNMARGIHESIDEMEENEE